MVGNNLKDTQLQQIVDKTIINADKDGDGRISFEEFCAVSRSPPGVFWVRWHFCWCGLLRWRQMSKGQKKLNRFFALARQHRVSVSRFLLKHGVRGYKHRLLSSRSIWWDTKTTELALRMCYTTGAQAPNERLFLHGCLSAGAYLMTFAMCETSSYS